MLFLGNETLCMLTSLNFSLSTWKKVVKGNEDMEDMATNAGYKVEKMEDFPFNFNKIMVLAL